MTLRTYISRLKMVSYLYIHICIYVVRAMKTTRDAFLARVNNIYVVYDDKREREKKINRRVYVHGQRTFIKFARETSVFYLYYFFVIKHVFVSGTSIEYCVSRKVFSTIAERQRATNTRLFIFYGRFSTLQKHCVQTD